MRADMKIMIALVCALVGLALGGCASTQPEERAVAKLNPTKGNKTAGTVTFTKTKRGVRVVAVVYGLTPGEHGFHIHEKGDCSAPDAMSAGAHFNPSGMPHGGPNSLRRHSGDFGNLVANDVGTARSDFVDPYLTFQGPSSIIGRAVIVHGQADDLITQPAGNAGTRVACGVIQKQ
jgi:superoxide dismutase, Cu-Zn family